MKRDHPIPVDVEVEPPALRTKRLHPGVVREHREIYVRGYIAGLGSPYRRPRPPIRVWIAVVLATAALVLTAFWAGHTSAAPLFAPYAESASPTHRTQIGASPTQSGATVPRATAIPVVVAHPTGEVGEPASYCKPGYCETPRPACSGTMFIHSSDISTPICQPKGSIVGQATWWNSFGDGIYTALRPDLGSKGDLVVVCGPVLPPGIVSTRGYQFHCRTANVITSCACLGPNSDRLVDLSLDLFREFADPSAGVVRITLQVLER